MKNDGRYNDFDLPFFRNEISSIIPDRVLDFHAHIWMSEHWKVVPWETDAAGAKYMVTQEQYSIEELIDDGRMLFPGKTYEAVCFGLPTPAADLEKTNAYSAKAGGNPGIYPLIVTGRDIITPDRLRQMICGDGFYGYKVFLNWYGNDYGSVTVEDMIGPAEMEIAHELNLVVLLHVPRDERLADPEIQAGVRHLSKEYPGAKIVLAHCGRAYLPDEMKKAIGSIKDLENVYLDTAMVMDPLVIERVFDTIDSSRLVFATDVPVALMRGRRVQVADHWVDLVYEDYAPSAYRVQSNNMRATFMVYEIIHAISRAGEMAGLSTDMINDVFFNNGMNVLKGVRNSAGGEGE